MKGAVGFLSVLGFLLNAAIASADMPPGSQVGLFRSSELLAFVILASASALLIEITLLTLYARIRSYQHLRLRRIIGIGILFTSTSLLWFVVNPSGADELSLYTALGLVTAAGAAVLYLLLPMKVRDALLASLFCKSISVSVAPYYSRLFLE